MNLFNYDGQIKFLCVCVWASDKQYHDIEGLEFHRVLASHFQYSYKEIVDIHGSIDGVGMWWRSGVIPPSPVENTNLLNSQSKGTKIGQKIGIKHPTHPHPPIPPRGKQNYPSEPPPPGKTKLSIGTPSPRKISRSAQDWKLCELHA